MHDVGLKLAIIGFAGIAAQWFAWRLHLPAIALLLLGGLLLGPGFHVIDVSRDFGEIYRPVVSLAVAIILFEGGLTLNFREIRETSKAVRRLITIGGPLAFLLGSLAGHYAGGLSWQVAIVLGGILVVTGPTVIMPMLRQAHLKTRPASLLRWEAIINDPLGALYAVIAFEIILILNSGHEASSLLLEVFLAFGVAIGGALLLARSVVWLFTRGHVPEFLKAPVLVALALMAFAATNLLLEEAGLLTVTVMGIALANSRIASLAEMRRFKETITVLLVSGVFVLLTASLTRETILSLGWEAAAFVFAILFVVRPIAVFVATIGTGITWQERLLTAWIAPRGIVAVAVTGLFSATMMDLGMEGAQKMIAYTFAVVAATILLHGFSLAPMARMLGLRSDAKPGLLIVGGSLWTTALAEKVMAMGTPVHVADDNWNRLAASRQRNIPTYFGDVMSERAHNELNLHSWAACIAATDNTAYNALVCTQLGPEIGRNRVFQLGGRGENERRDLHFTIGGRPLTKEGLGFEELNDRMLQGWTFTSTPITGEFGFEQFLESRPEGTIILFWVRSNGDLRFASTDKESVPNPGSIVLTFGPRLRNSEGEAVNAGNGKKQESGK
jgi:NhaP-type Na+/H+ or K+/H+ antiporter